MSLRAAFEDILEIEEPHEDISYTDVLEEASKIEVEIEVSDRLQTGIESAEELFEHTADVELTDSEQVMYQHALEAILRSVYISVDLAPSLESADQKKGFLKRMWEALIRALKSIKDGIVNFFKSIGKFVKGMFSNSKENEKVIKEELAKGNTEVERLVVHADLGTTASSAAEVNKEIKETIKELKEPILPLFGKTKSEIEAEVEKESKAFNDKMEALKKSSQKTQNDTKAQLKEIQQMNERNEELSKMLDDVLTDFEKIDKEVRRRAAAGEKTDDAVVVAALSKELEAVSKAHSKMTMNKAKQIGKLANGIDKTVKASLKTVVINDDDSISVV